MLEFDHLVPFAGPHEVDSRVFGKETRYLAVPWCLLHCDIAQQLPLRPIAIQLERESGAVVFLPSDGEAWLAAKLYSANADFLYHQFKTHALWCHLSQEPLAVSVMRMLPSCHPVFQLLRPHFRGLLYINHLARGSLVAGGLLVGCCISDDNGDVDLTSAAGDVTTVGAIGNVKVFLLLPKLNTFAPSVPDSVSFPGCCRSIQNISIERHILQHNSSTKRPIGSRCRRFSIS